MRMYLSSFRVGNCPDRLVALATSNRAAVIANAMDAAPAEARDDSVQRELTALSALGFVTDELDLRDYSGDARALVAAFRRYGVLWLRGGNTFVLRAALARSGGDAAITELLHNDEIVYAGYSAGPCVLAPSLRGLETVDDPNAVSEVSGDEPIWEGLGLLPYALVPHFDSPGHPESEALGEVAKRYRAEGVPHRTLRDGEVLIIDGDQVTACH